MITLLRRAGTGRFFDGSRIVWTVAEGERGRRWRWTHASDAGVIGTALLELETDGRLGRVELAGPNGLLTLHPADDGRAIHGNIATPSGMRHLAFPWSNQHDLVVEGEPLVTAAACHRLARHLPVGEEQDRPILVVEHGWALRECSARVAHETAQRWRVDASPHPKVRLAIDADGLPVGLRDEVAWPLELGRPG